MSTIILPLPPGKHVAYDRDTDDYAAFYDGELLGYRPTQPEAQTLADTHARELLRRQPVAEAAHG